MAEISKEHRLVLRMCLVALFGALSYILTAFCQIPYGVGGYFNFGDIINLLASIALGPIEGALVGALGGTFSDLTMGYVAYAPWTLGAKALMGLVAGLLYNVLKNHKYIRFISLFIGGLMEVGLYMACYYVLLGVGGLAQSPFDLVQAFGSAVITIPLFLLLEKSKVLERL